MPDSRVAAITTNDGGSALTVTTDYDLHDGVDAGSSSGVSRGRPDFSRVVTSAPDFTTYGAPNRTDLRFRNGSHVCYGTVKTTTPGAGYTIAEFETPVERAYRDMSPSDTRWWFDRKADRPIKTRLYEEGSSQPYSTSTYDYADGYQPSNYAAVVGYKVRPAQTPDHYSATSYSIPLTIPAFATEITTIVDDRATRVVREANTALHGPYPYRTTTHLPDGTQSREELAYTRDYAYGSGQLNELRALNAVAIPYRTYTYKDGQPLRFDPNEYAFFNGGSGVRASSKTSGTRLVPYRTKFWSYVTEEHDWGSVSSRSHSRVLSEVLAVDSKYRPTRIDQRGRDLPLELAYRADDLLQSRTVGNGTTTYAYDGTRRLQSTTDARGVTTDYTYDAHNRPSGWTGCDGSEERVTYRAANADLGGAHSRYAVTRATRATGSAALRYAHTLHDGFGRVVQRQSVGTAASGYSDAGANGTGIIVDETRYDALGRQSRTYAPVTIARSGAQVPQKLNLPSDARYTDYDYEASARGRLLTATQHNGFATSYDHGYSTAAEASAGGYPANFSAGGLARTTVTDFGGHVTETLVDSWGNTIVEREYEQGGGGQRDVRYGYDFQNDLRRVEPFDGATDADGTTYRYDYDHISQLIRRRIPGKARELFKYDLDGHLVAHQDHYARTRAGGEVYWVYAYDSYGNRVTEGINAGAFAYPHSVDEPLSEWDYDYAAGSISFGTAPTWRTRMLGAAEWIESTTAYDRGANPCGEASRLTEQSTLNRAGGTASATRVTDLAYGAHGELEREDVDTYLPGGTLRETTAYDLNAALQPGAVDYDVAYGGRTGFAGELYADSYTAYGELAMRGVAWYGRHSRYGHDQYLQHINYRYDDIGRLTAINQPLGGNMGPLVVGDGGTGRRTALPAATPQIHDEYAERSRDVFYEGISYGDRYAGVASSFARGLHAGLISQTVKSVQGRYPVVESYDYDGYLRLERFEAVELAGRHADVDYSAPNARHADATYDYDDYDRPTDLTRWALSGASLGRRKIDQLTYSYADDGAGPKGPMAREVYDLAGDDRGHAQRSGGGTGYTYNADGAVERDPDRQLAYAYNELGLVSEVSRTTGSARVEYLYTADGTLRRHRLYANTGALLEDVHYVGGMRVDAAAGPDAEVYVPNAVGATLFGAGGATPQAIFYHADHLGNVMLAFSDFDGDHVIDTWSEVLEESRYFPYGMKLPVYADRQAGQLPFAFNGAEELEEFGSLHLTTFRTMAPETGLWSQVDPKAEKFYGSSPYTVNGANPISYADPHGDEIITAIVVGALIGSAISSGTTVASNLIAGQDWNQGLGQAALIGAVGGAVSGGVGHALAGKAIGQGLSGALIKSSASYAATSAITGDPITLGSAAAVLTGAALYSGIPGFTGVEGGAVANIAAEVAHEGLTGAFVGGISGGVGAAVDGGDIGAGFLAGARGGAIGGVARAGLNVATMGAAYVPSDPSAYGDFGSVQPVFRRGTFITRTFASGGGVALGRNLVTNQLSAKQAARYGIDAADFNHYLRAHEAGHFAQQRQLGIGQFYGRTGREYLSHGLRHVYSTSGTLEYGAERYAFGRVGYYYNTRGVRSTTFP